MSPRDAQCEARLAELDAEIERIAALEGDALVEACPAVWS